MSRPAKPALPAAGETSAAAAGAAERLSKIAGYRCGYKIPRLVSPIREGYLENFQALPEIRTANSNYKVDWANFKLTVKIPSHLLIMSAENSDSNFKFWFFHLLIFHSIFHSSGSCSCSIVFSQDFWFLIFPFLAPFSIGRKHFSSGAKVRRKHFS